MDVNEWLRRQEAAAYERGDLQCNEYSYTEGQIAKAKAEASRLIPPTPEQVAKAKANGAVLFPNGVKITIVDDAGEERELRGYSSEQREARVNHMSFDPPKWLSCGRGSGRVRMTREAMEGLRECNAASEAGRVAAFEHRAAVIAAYGTKVHQQGDALNLPSDRWAQDWRYCVDGIGGPLPTLLLQWDRIREAIRRVVSARRSGMSNPACETFLSAVSTSVRDAGLASHMITDMVMGSCALACDVTWDKQRGRIMFTSPRDPTETIRAALAKAIRDCVAAIRGWLESIGYPQINPIVEQETDHHGDVSFWCSGHEVGSCSAERLKLVGDGVHPTALVNNPQGALAAALELSRSPGVTPDCHRACAFGRYAVRVFNREEDHGTMKWGVDETSRVVTLTVDRPMGHRARTAFLRLVRIGLADGWRAVIESPSVPSVGDIVGVEIRGEIPADRGMGKTETSRSITAQIQEAIEQRLHETLRIPKPILFGEDPGRAPEPLPDCRCIAPDATAVIAVQERPEFNGYAICAWRSETEREPMDAQLIACTRAQVDQIVRVMRAGFDQVRVLAPTEIWPASDGWRMQAMRGAAYALEVAKPDV